MFYFAFCQGDILLTKELSVPQGETAPFSFKLWQTITTIQAAVDADGTLADCIVIRLDAPLASEGFVMMPLRKSYDVLPPILYQLAGKCAELIYFDQNSKFCGCCGAPMKWESDINKKCTGCGKQLWPQLQTAIIVRITRNSDESHTDDEILLVHGRNFRGNFYGLVAGFVETGETLEECVRREVREEVGLEIDDIKYFGSQPWPYPCGLMVGFTARYVSGDIKLQKSEIAGGGWFGRDNLPKIPGPVSIAGQLIRDWMNTDI